MTTTPSDDYDTAGLVQGSDGLTSEDGGATPGPGPEGTDLGESEEQTSRHAADVEAQYGRTPGPGPDGSDLGEPEDEVAKVRKAHIAKHAADHGRTPGPGPRG